MYKLYIDGKHTATYDSQGMMETGVEDLPRDDLSHDQKNALTKGFRVVVDAKTYELKSTAFQRRERWAG